MIIDVHTHVFPDELAVAQVPKMAEIAGITAALDGRKASLLDSMKEAGIMQSWLQPVATRPKQVDKINAWGEEIRSGALVAFGAFHPDCNDLPGLIHDLARRGFPGIKIHPEYQTITPDDARLFPLYEASIDEGMIVLFHAGVDIGIPTVNSTPSQFVKLLDRFPKMTAILAHLGGFKQWEAVLNDLCGADVFLDTSYVFGHITEDEFMEIVRRHGVTKILFGTDSPWAGQRVSVEQIERLPLSDEELDLILGVNADTLLRRTMDRLDLNRSM